MSKFAVRALANSITPELRCALVTAGSEGDAERCDDAVATLYRLTDEDRDVLAAAGRAA